MISAKLVAKQIEKYLHDWDKILYWKLTSWSMIVFIAEYLVVIYCIKDWIRLFRNKVDRYFILKTKITLFFLLSIVFIRSTTCCHSLLLIDICYHSLSLVVSRWIVVAVGLKTIDQIPNTAANISQIPILW